MKKLTIISGKGGTGKTSLAASFAALTGSDAVFVDGDVDAANLSLIMKPVLVERHEFSASRVAAIDPEKCENCNLCHELCRFDAITPDFTIDPISCEGCAFCFHACPHDAIVMEERVSGEWFVSETPYGKLVHAQLGIAEENSGKLVTIVRNRGRELAEIGNCEFLIIDGPPGIGCPVIASLSGVDAALIVTEPTVSGIHDMKRALALCRHFSVPAAVCINRFDLEKEQTASIEKYCRDEEVSLVGKVPFDRSFVEAIIKGLPVIEYAEEALKATLTRVWRKFVLIAS